jgi:riboflavin synthase
MFTGLIEDVGEILKKGNNYLIIKTGLENIKIGDSVAVNGACLTAVEIMAKNIKFDVMPETFDRSNLKFLPTNSKVNLERAMILGERLDGHIVQGHVEGLGKFSSIRIKDNAKILKITSNT